jgi:hypothetical protein
VASHALIVVGHLWIAMARTFSLQSHGLEVLTQRGDLDLMAAANVQW